LAQRGSLNVASAHLPRRDKATATTIALEKKISKPGRTVNIAIYYSGTELSDMDAPLRYGASDHGDYRWIMSAAPRHRGLETEAKNPLENSGPR
jgi:hypothetical protein